MPPNCLHSSCAWQEKRCGCTGRVARHLCLEDLCQRCYQPISRDLGSGSMQNGKFPQMTREQAAAELWKLALASSSTRTELAQTNYAEIASRLFENGLSEEQHVSAGLLAAMAADDVANESVLRMAVSTRIVAGMSRTFASDTGHDRTKVWLIDASFGRNLHSMCSCSLRRGSCTRLCLLPASKAGSYRGTRSISHSTLAYDIVHPFKH